MKIRFQTLAILLAACCLAVMLAGCAGKEPRTPSGMMDSPEHHYKTGMHYLDKKDAGRAISEFDKALELDPEYGPALAGRGLAKAMLGDAEGIDQVDDALDEATNPEQEIRALVARIRTLTAMADAKGADVQELLEEGEDAYDDAMDIIEDSPRLETPELYYYQGELYLRALKMEQAEEMYRRVLDLHRGMEAEAQERWELVQKVRRAAPQTHVGLKIALVEQITRADMAALLVEELNFDDFLSRTGVPADTSFKAPTKPDQAWKQEQGGGMMTDVSGHPLSGAIEIVTGYGVRGLKSFPDNTFRPDQVMTRAEVAMVLEDILIRAANEPTLATRYIGQASPFSDLRADHPAFNAAMLTTTRGLLATEGRSGSFEPMAPVSGVDALLAVKKLKEELRVF